jgi:hypothetical protein
MIFINIFHTIANHINKYMKVNVSYLLAVRDMLIGYLIWIISPQLQFENLI